MEPVTEVDGVESATDRPADDVLRGDRSLLTLLETATNSPLIGRDRRITTLAVCYVLAFTSMVVVATVVDGSMAPTDTPPGWFDGLRAWIIVVAMSLFLVVPIVYAATNGGSLVAFGLALWPFLLVPIVSGTLSLTTDLGIALVVGATAATIGTFASVTSRTPTWAVDTSSPAFENGLLVSSGATVLAGTATWKLVGDVAHPFSDIGIVVAIALVVPITLVALGWGLWFRSTRPRRT